jgi:predicted house-cleaning NTP pyrophosphatase (Maf/HAM1 superfamily)
MYADTGEVFDVGNNLPIKNDKTAPKVKSKNIVELMDVKGNKINVSTAYHVASLEKQIEQQNKIIKTQEAQIKFLMNKLSEVQNDFKHIQEGLRFLGDKY